MLDHAANEIKASRAYLRVEYCCFPSFHLNNTFGSELQFPVEQRRQRSSYLVFNDVRCTLCYIKTYPTDENISKTTDHNISPVVQGPSAHRHFQRSHNGLITKKANDFGSFDLAVFASE